MWIIDFYNTDKKYLCKLNDNIIKTFIGIKFLNASFPNVTDSGIKHLKLHTLNASDNPKITDNGIKHMRLHTLDASHNEKIIDNGIKYMQLHILFAVTNSNITNNGIKHMQLQKYIH